MSHLPDTRFSALVLAGDRRADDPLLKAGGVATKALLPVAGVPMLQRVLEALAASPSIHQRWLCGPAMLAQHPAFNSVVSTVRWLEGADSPSRSAARGLAAIPDTQAVLLTTADHALLNPTMVEYFCRQALERDADVLVALAPYPQIQAAFPGVRRTVLKLDQGYCGCNLFAFMSPRGRTVTEYWQRLEDQRKQPLKMLAQIGWWPALRYALGTLTLPAAMALLSRRLGVKAEAILMPFPAASVDVDTPADWQFVESLLKQAYVDPPLPDP